jgi:hypothetical protein
MKKKKIKKTIPEKIPKRYFVVWDSIFKQKINVLLNHSPEEYEKWLNKNKVKDIVVKDYNDFSGWVSEFTTEKGKTERILFLTTFQWAIKHQSTLIHEIVHVIIKIWQFNNIPFNADTQEFLAHSIANLYEDIAEKLLVKKSK